MTDRSRARHTLEGLRSKDLGNETHSLVNCEGTLRTFGGHDARAFLATMLQRKKASNTRCSRRQDVPKMAKTPHSWVGLDFWNNGLAGGRERENGAFTPRFKA